MATKDASRLSLLTLGLVVLGSFAPSCGSGGAGRSPNPGQLVDGGSRNPPHGSDGGLADGADRNDDSDGNDDGSRPADATDGERTSVGGAGGAAGGAGGATGTADAGVGGQPPPELLVPLFRAARTVGPSGQVARPTPVDLDGDGWLDLAWTAPVHAGLEIAINDRAGGFRDLVRSEPLLGNGALAFGDFNGDGRLEPAMLDRTSSILNLTAAIGDRTFKTIAQIPLSFDSLGVFAVGDLNGDRKSDVVVAGMQRPPSKTLVMHVVPGVGDGATATVTSFEGIEGALVSAWIQDLDQDGRHDLLIATNTTTYVFRNNGGASFSNPSSHPVGMPVAVSDFDGDGRLDLLGRQGAASTILLRRGETFEPSPVAPDFCSASAVAAGDVNGDGHVDVACSDNAVRLYLNQGGGAFGSPRALLGKGVVTTILDWDHDGDADLLANDGTTVFFNEGGTLPEGATELGLPIAWRWAKSVDLDGDAIPDVLAATESRLSKLIVGPDGALGPEVRVADYAFMGPPGIGELGGAAGLDLVLPTNEPSGRVGVSMNDGQGQFAPPAFFATGPYPIAAEVADLNRDGKGDIVTLVAGGFSVLLNDGRSEFPSHTDYDALDAFNVTTGDVDGDGVPDIVTVVPGGMTVSRNQGDGTFAPAVSYPSALVGSLIGARATSSVAIVDLTGDDRPEVVVAAPDDLVVHRNNGDGTFGTLLPLGGRTVALANDPHGSVSLTVCRLNDDHFPDLVAIYGFSERRTVRTYFSDGGGILWRGEAYALAPTPFDVARGDLDRDGRVELVPWRP